MVPNVIGSLNYDLRLENFNNRQVSWWRHVRYFVILFAITFTLLFLYFQIHTCVLSLMLHILLVDWTLMRNDIISYLTIANTKAANCVAESGGVHLSSPAATFYHSSSQPPHTQAPPPPPSHHTAPSHHHPAPPSQQQAHHQAPHHAPPPPNSHHHHHPSAPHHHSNSNHHSAPQGGSHHHGVGHHTGQYLPPGAREDKHAHSVYMSSAVARGMTPTGTN